MKFRTLVLSSLSAAHWSDGLWSGQQCLKGIEVRKLQVGLLYVDGA